MRPCALCLLPGPDHHENVVQQLSRGTQIATTVHVHRHCGWVVRMYSAVLAEVVAQAEALIRVGAHPANHGPVVTDHGVFIPNPRTAVQAAQLRN